MPITIKSTELKYKNPSTGQYQGVDAVAEMTTSEQCALIEAKGAETRASIPNDYTALSDQVNAIDSKLGYETVTITSTSPYIVNAGGVILNKNLLFLNFQISKNLPAGAFQNLQIAMSIPSPRRQIFSIGGISPSGTVSYGTASDKAKVVNTRIGNSNLTICTSEAMLADLFVTFVCPIFESQPT